MHLLDFVLGGTGLLFGVALLCLTHLSSFARRCSHAHETVLEESQGAAGLVAKSSDDRSSDWIARDAVRRNELKVWLVAESRNDGLFCRSEYDRWLRRLGRTREVRL
jgi:hypothetical protein